MANKRFAIMGTGFWSTFQLAAWHEIEGATCVALYNRTRSRAEELGRRFGISAIYDDPEKLLASEELDFVDIITDVDTHRPFTELALKRGIDVICQKPMAPSLELAGEMVHCAHATGRKLYIHENWRWQPQIRAVREAIDAGRIGKPWRATVVYANSFPVFENQPFLRELDRFILIDMGTHILDSVRYLFGECRAVYCQTHSVNPGIRGEDAASLLLSMRNGMTVAVDISYASRLATESFPETYIKVEGADASLELTRGYRLNITTRDGIRVETVAPPWYSWADSRYGVVHASIVGCNANLLGGLRGEERAETTAEDNYETLRLVYSAYESAKAQTPIVL